MSPMVTVVVAVISAIAGAGAAWFMLLRRRAATPVTPTITETAPAQPAPSPRRHTNEELARQPAAELARQPAAELARQQGPTWASVVDTLNLGVVVMGRNGAVRYRNHKAMSMAGTHTGLLIDEAVEVALRRALDGEDSRQTLELYGPPQVAVVVAAEPLDDGSAVATIEDVSDRRRLDAVRTDFVANISHELKTPVGALAVLADALADEDDISVVHRVAERMVNESHRVARTIDDLMELSRIELGEEPVRDVVPVIDVVAGAIERAAPLSEGRNIDVAVLEVPDGVAILGDRRQLTSALGNLVENAVKYSEVGANVQIRVRVVSDGADDAQRFAELMVADQGIGIPAADHGRIFERFYRVDKARGRDTGGTGLGLSIVRHVATNHGGEVLVSSQEGEGSTFVLRIPLAPQHQNQSKSAAGGSPRQRRAEHSPPKP
jgi:two-component system sensor histidine kinase SenX3